MDDALFVRVLQPLGNLLADVQGFIEGNGERGPLTRSRDAGPPSPRGRGQVSLFLALPSPHGRGRTLCFALPSPSGRGAGGEGIAAAYALRQGQSLDQLHCQRAVPVGLLQTVSRSEVAAIERGQHLRL